VERPVQDEVRLDDVADVVGLSEPGDRDRRCVVPSDAEGVGAARAEDRERRPRIDQAGGFETSRTGGESGTRTL
jgi:hypothetical protein